MMTENDELERRLAAILSADVVGFSALMGENEEGVIRAVKALWKNILGPSAQKAGGRIVKTMGDGVLVEFPSAVKAVQCALSVQEATAAGETAFPDGIQLVLRIGLHVGDVVIDGDDILGDGVNLASRLEGIAEPGGICISAAVRDQLTGELTALFSDDGEHRFKNIARPVRVYVLGSAENETPKQSARRASGARKPTIALGSFGSLTSDETSIQLSQGCQQTTAAFLSSLTGLKLVSPNASPDFLVEASFQVAGNRYRCLLKMIENSQETPVLSNRIDGNLEDIFEAQDDLAGRIATTIRYSILEHEAARVEGSTDIDENSEQILAKAGQFMLGPNLAEWDWANQALDRLLEKDPKDFMALSMKACALFKEAICGMQKTPEAHADRAKECLAKARKINEQSDFLHLIRALYYYEAERDLDAAMRAIDRSLNITPNYVLALIHKAFYLSLAGKGKEGLEMFSQVLPALEKNIFSHRMLCIKSICHFSLGDFESSLQSAQQSLEHAPDYPKSLAMLAAAAMMSGREPLAKSSMSSLLERSPNLNRNTLSPPLFQDERRLSDFHASLISAGLP